MSEFFILLYIIYKIIAVFIFLFIITVVIEDFFNNIILSIGMMVFVPLSWPILLLIDIVPGLGEFISNKINLG